MSSKIVIVASCVIFLTGQAVGAPLKITNYDQGRYDLNNQAAGDTGAFANYIVGALDGIPDPSQSYDGFSYDFANFFSFDLTGVAPGSIKWAKLHISGGQNVFDSGPNGVFDLYGSAVDPSSDEAGFTSGLTTDPLIGSVTVRNGGTLSSSNLTPSDITLFLNATGLADLNAAAGEPGAKFFIGGTFTGANPYVLLPGPGGLTFANLFNGSGNVSGATLTVSSVPEPSTWAMILIGFAGLGAAAHRASRRKAAVAL